MTLRIPLPALIALLALALSCGDDTVQPGPGPKTPDRIAPEPVDDLALSFDAGNDAVAFEWTSRRMHARVDLGDKDAVQAILDRS